MSDELDLPDDHPLAGREDLLDTHSGHLEAYAGVLDDADPDDVHGVMLVVYGETGIDTLPTVAPDVDPRIVSLRMLGAHIRHVANAARDGTTMEDVAQDAIDGVRRGGYVDE